MPGCRELEALSVKRSLSKGIMESVFNVLDETFLTFLSH